jgi:methylmalonyl-CoA epimerase
MNFDDIKLPVGMAGNVDHIGIAVENLEDSIKLYKGLLGLELDGIEEVPREKVRVAFLRLNNASGIGHIELLEPMDPDSNIGRFIERKGAGLHHVAFAAANMDKALADCRDAGLRMLSDEPMSGAHGKQVMFMHPKSTGGVLIEICADGPSE